MVKNKNENKKYRTQNNITEGQTYTCNDYRVAILSKS